jgi:hypothetical protein
VVRALSEAPPSRRLEGSRARAAMQRISCVWIWARRQASSVVALVRRILP